jgi:molybdopterin converting factor small subunit
LIIKVKGYLTYRDVIGKKDVLLPDDYPPTLREFLRDQAIEIGEPHSRSIYDEETGMVGEYVAVMLNGSHYRHLKNGLDTILKDQDEIAIFPPGAGG